MNILLINHYAGSVHHGMEYRPYYLAREWVRRGHRVHIVAASCSHLRRQAPPLGDGAWSEENIDGIHYIWLHTPPYRGNGAARVRNMLAFVARLWQDSARLARSAAPDAVIASSTYPLDIWPAHRIARLAGARLVHEVHDLWPLSPIELGGYSRCHPFIMLLQAAENHACRHADAIVSILPKVREHLQARGMARHKLHIVPNGVDPDEWPVTSYSPMSIAAGQAPTNLPAAKVDPNISTTSAATGMPRRATTAAPAITTSKRKEVPANDGAAMAAGMIAAAAASSMSAATISRTGAALPTSASSAALGKAPAALSDAGRTPASRQVKAAQPASPNTTPPLTQLLPELALLLSRLIESGKTVVAYTGSHGIANALDTLLDAARLLHDQPLAFVLVGAGPEKERLQQKAQRRELPQVHFAAPVAKRQMPALLANVDIAFLGWRRQPLYRFGIAPNKLLDYMMAGCPVLHAVDAGNDPVAEAGCGVSVAPDDPAALAHGLLRLLALGPEQRRALGARGRQYALDHFTYPVLAQRFLDVLAQELPHG